LKILIVGGSSCLAEVLQPGLLSCVEVMTAGRTGCDVPLDLSWPEEQLRLPLGIDAVVHLAAHFGGKDFVGMLTAEQVNA